MALKMIDGPYCQCWHAVSHGYTTWPFVVSYRIKPSKADYDLFLPSNIKSTKRNQEDRSKKLINSGKLVHIHNKHVWSNKLINIYCFYWMLVIFMKIANLLICWLMRRFYKVYLYPDELAENTQYNLGLLVHMLLCCNYLYDSNTIHKV